MKFICLTLLTILSLNCFSICVEAQQRKIPKQPFQITDASTGKPISEILIIPRYSSAAGVFIAPEGRGKGTYGNYLDKPFVYRTGEPFILKLPKSSGILLFPFFIGKGRTIQGITIIAAKYRPLRVSDLWSTGDKRTLQLIPISDSEWSLLLEKELNPFIKDVSRINDGCRFWDIAEPCALGIDFDKKERELVRSFLQEDRNKNK